MRSKLKTQKDFEFTEIKYQNSFFHDFSHVP